MRGVLLVALAVTGPLTGGCANAPPGEPLKLEGNMLTVDNRTAQEWGGVFRRTQIHSLRLTAKLPDGAPLELKKEFEVGGLAGALKGFGGKR